MKERMRRRHTSASPPRRKSTSRKKKKRGSTSRRNSLEGLDRGHAESKRNSVSKKKRNSVPRRNSLSRGGSYEDLLIDNTRRNSRSVSRNDRYIDDYEYEQNHIWDRFHEEDSDIENEFEKPQIRNLDKDEYTIFGGIWIATIPPINTNGEEVVLMQDGMVFSKGQDTYMRFDVQMCRLFSMIHNDVWQLVHIDDTGSSLGFHYNGESMIWKRKTKKVEELDPEQRNFYLKRPARKRGKIVGMSLFSCASPRSNKSYSSSSCFSLF